MPLQDRLFDKSYCLMMNYLKSDHSGQLTIIFPHMIKGIKKLYESGDKVNDFTTLRNNFSHVNIVSVQQRAGSIPYLLNVRGWTHRAFEVRLGHHEWASVGKVQHVQHRSCHARKHCRWSNRSSEADKMVEGMPISFIWLSSMRKVIWAEFFVLPLFYTKAILDYPLFSLVYLLIMDPLVHFRNIPISCAVLNVATFSWSTLI